MNISSLNCSQVLIIQLIAADPPLQLALPSSRQVLAYLSHTLRNDKAGESCDIMNERTIPDDQAVTAEGDFLPIRENRIVRPSDMIAVPEAWLMKGANRPFEAVTDMPGSTLRLGYSSTWGYYPGELAPQQLRHNGRFNVVFCDGHQDSQRLTQKALPAEAERRG